MKMKRKKIFYIRIFLPVLALAVFACVCIYSRFFSKRAEDIRRLSEESYNAVFISMYSTEGYLPEDFAFYRGVQTLVLDSGPTKLRTLSDYIDAAFASSNEIEIMYLGLDPAAIWDSCLHREKLWNERLESVFAYMDTHTDVTFEVMLPYPSLSYWTAMSEEKLDETLLMYQKLGEALCGRPNVLVYYMGAEEWLIANPDNYLAGFGVVNPGLAHKIMLLNFCDKVFLVDKDVLSEKLAFLRSYVMSEKASPVVYADLSDWYFVFLGDSVMVYDTGTASIPGVVCGLSGAEAANLSQGGSPATADPAASISLERMVDALETLDLEAYKEVGDFYDGLEKYKTDMDNGTMEGKQVCFVICLGLNDYFGAHPADRPSAPYDTGSYGGALRSAVRRLKELAPDGRILIMTPNYCDAFSGGTETIGPEGGVLTDYVDVAVAVCREMGVECADIYADSGIDALTQSLYLADGVHPNEAGRYLMGRFLVNTWGKILDEN